MKQFEEETIAAIATPKGRGAIAAIRISGGKSQFIIKKLFSLSGNTPNLTPFKLHYGWINDPKTRAPIDEATFVFFRAPKSYTGEEMAEIFCHGGEIVTEQILSCILSLGARLAAPGEFAKRAFINGKIDLNKAEGIIDLINAKSPAAALLAAKEMKGEVGLKTKEIREKLAGLMVQMEGNLDFPDDVSEVKTKEVLRTIRQAQEGIKQLLAGFNGGKIIREGARVLIAGRPNVGKSSLLNALLAEERAIVDPFPGTTRDLVEEEILIAGYPFVLVDSAGLREANGRVEKEGIRRTLDEGGRADLVLFLVEAKTGLTKDDREALKKIDNNKIIIVFNKADQGVGREAQRGVKISALKKTGLIELKKKIFKLAVDKYQLSAERVYINLRQKTCLTKAKVCLEEMEKGLKTENLASDCLTIDLKNAINALDELTGQKIDKELLDRLFSDFCVGK